MVTTILTRLLVPIDGSEQSQRALEYAEDVAKKNGAHITLCHVVDTQQFIAAAPFPAYFDPSIAIQALRDGGREFLEHGRAHVAAAGIECSTQLIEDHYVTGILDAAKLDSSDCIVMGSHGRRGLDRFFVGSTTEGVLRRALVPVIVIRTASSNERPAHAVTRTGLNPIPTGA